MIKQKIIGLFKKTCGLIVISVCMVQFIGCNKSWSTTETVKDVDYVSEEKVIKQEELIDADTILLVTGEYAPYTTEGEVNMGFFTEIIKAAFNKSGMKYKVEFYPWARCSEMVETGEAWATFPYTSMEELPNDIYFSDPVFPSSHLFYYYKGNGKVNNEVLTYSKISHFPNSFIFGGANDYWYGNKESMEQNGVEVEWANDTVALVKMLRSGRIDFLIEDELVCDEIIKRLFPDEVDLFMKLPNEAKSVSYHLVVSKEYPNTMEIRDRFNRAIMELIESGEYQEILEKNGIQYKLSR